MNRRVFQLIILATLLIVAFFVPGAEADTRRRRAVNVHYTLRSFDYNVERIGPTMDIRPGKSTTKQRLSAEFNDANSEHLSIADNTSLSMSDIDFSIAGWLYLDDIGSNHTFVGKYTSSGNQREYLLYYDSSAAGFFWTVSSNGTSTTTVQSDVDLTPTVTPSAGVWYFLVLTHEADNDVLRMTIKGSGVDSTGTVATSSGVFDGSAEFNIGSYNAGASAFNDGSIASIGVWKNRAITADEATTLYNNGKPLRYNDLPSDLTTNLESYWDLDESSGTRYDSAGSNDLTDNGTVTSRYSLEGSGVYDSVVGQIDSTIGSVSFTQSTDANKPLLTEGGRRENLAPYSEDTTQSSAWTDTRGSAGASTETHPDGLTAKLFTEDGSASTSHLFEQDTIPVVSGETYRIIMDVKPEGDRNARIRFATGFPLSIADFDLSDVSVYATQGSPQDVSIEALADGWYRISATETASSTATSRLLFNVLDASVSDSYTGDSSSGLHVSRFIMQRASMNPTYIPTQTLPRHGSLTGQRGLRGDSTDYLATAAYNSATDFTGDFSLFAIVEPTKFSSSTNYTILDNETTSAKGILWRLQGDNVDSLGMAFRTNFPSTFTQMGPGGSYPIFPHVPVIASAHKSSTSGSLFFDLDSYKTGTLTNAVSASSNVTGLMAQDSGAEPLDGYFYRAVGYKKALPTSTRQRLIKGFKRFYRVQ